MGKQPKTPCQIMVEENEIQYEETSALLTKINNEHPGFLGPMISVKPEEAPNYDPNMPDEDVYRELARLNYRGVLFTPSAINYNYLKSVLPLYDALMPLIKDEWAKKIAKGFKAVVEERLGALENFGERVKKLKR